MARLGDEGLDFEVAAVLGKAQKQLALEAGKDAEEVMEALCRSVSLANQEDPGVRGELKHAVHLLYSIVMRTGMNPGLTVRTPPNVRTIPMLTRSIEALAERQYVDALAHVATVYAALRLKGSEDGA